jgi:uncharacterized integral membrane protein
VKPVFGIRLGTAIVLLVILVVLIVQNVTAATLRLFFWEFSVPVIAVVLVSLLAGFLIGLLFQSLTARGAKKTARPENPKERKPS